MSITDYVIDVRDAIQAGIDRAAPST